MRIAALALVLVAGTLFGCAYTTSSNPAYLAAARRPPPLLVDGKVLVVTTPQDDAYSFTGSPTSYTGSATTLTLPLGSMIRETAVAAFADAFKGGADANATILDAERYTVIVAPKLVSYSYEYNQLKNVGFAITPTAVVNVDVRVIGAKGATSWQRSYASGPVEGVSYALNMSPQEEISKTTYKAMYNLFSKAASDIAREVLAKEPPAQAGS
ncbi:MAG TPA: hypothetical protein VML91_15910 [Burkholderiales bacterium]|nr:hypothetical protein [Burkholderiales bacterium]